MIQNVKSYPDSIQSGRFHRDDSRDRSWLSSPPGRPLEGRRIKEEVKKIKPAQGSDVRNGDGEEGRRKMEDGKWGMENGKRPPARGVLLLIVSF